MSFSQTVFDFTNIDTSRPPALSEGFYELIITQIEDKDQIKNGLKTGEMLVFSFSPTQHTNITITDYICYKHQNTTVQEIAWKKLATLSISAFGEKRKFDDIQVFVSKLVYAHVKLEEFQGKQYPKIHYFLTHEEFAAVKEKKGLDVSRPASKSNNTSTTASIINPKDDDVPF